jgi:hypothetical protein
MTLVRWDSCHSRRLTSTNRFVRWGSPQPPLHLVVRKPKERGMWKEPSPTVAEVLHDVDASRTE